MMRPMQDVYRGSWALVTGASSGLGEQFARQLAALGSHLVLSARSEGKLRELGDALSAEHGVACRTIACDLARPEELDRLFAEIDGIGEPIDHVVNDAGVGRVGRFSEMPADEQLYMLRLNCEALMRITHHFLPKMLARERGGFIQVASTSAYQPMPFMATYGATKAFVLSFSSALSVELRGTGVRMLALCPGPVATGFHERAGTELGAERVAALSAEQTVERALKAYAAGRSVLVPGAVNRAHVLGTSILPQRLLARAVEQGMRWSGRHPDVARKNGG